MNARIQNIIAHGAMILGLAALAMLYCGTATAQGTTTSTTTIDADAPHDNGGSHLHQNGGDHRPAGHLQVRLQHRSVADHHSARRSERKLEGDAADFTTDPGDGK
ncbi:MAG: hypothetical protein ABI599_02525 [Flavobacteriales bacterium]